MFQIQPRKYFMPLMCVKRTGKNHVVNVDFINVFGALHWLVNVSDRAGKVRNTVICVFKYIMVFRIKMNGKP